MRVPTAIQGAFGAFYAVGAFWAFSVALGITDFGMGLERSAFIVLGVTGIVLMGRLRPRSGAAVAVALVIAAAGLLALRSAQLAATVVEDRYPTIDIGQTTITAVDMWSRGQNPYVVGLDPGGARVDPTGEGFRYFAGYKYGTAMIWGYYPLVKLWGATGLFATNFIALLATAGAAYFWASSARGHIAGIGAFTLALAPGFIDIELFVGGVTDILPVALGIVGFALRAHGRTLPSAVALGLSFAAKPLPALIYALPMMASGPRKLLFSGVALVTGVVAYLPPLLESPKELLAGLFVFHMVRPADDTSLLASLPDFLVPVVAFSTLWIAMLITAFWALDAKDRSPWATATVTSVAMAVFFFGSKLVHRNFLLWLMPLLAVGVATSLWTSHIGKRTVTYPRPPAM